MSVPSSATAAFLSSPRQMLIGAEWRDALSGERLDVRDPATGEAVTSVPAAAAADVDLAVRAARAAFESREWGSSRPVDRERWLLKLADLLETNDDSVFYYRIHSPVVLIEFDHQTPVGLTHLYPRGVPYREHIHAVVRTPNGNDYGKDLLRHHYERQPH